MFELEKLAVEQSETMEKLIKEMGTDGAIPLDNVTGSILSRVIKYCCMHTLAAAEAGKVKNMGPRAVDYLNIKELLDLTCQKAAYMISGKTTEEM
ncbi:SKP1-like protein 3, partial [Linum grandiflorum]